MIERILFNDFAPDAFDLEVRDGLELVENVIPVDGSWRIPRELTHRYTGTNPAANHVYYSEAGDQWGAVRGAKGLWGGVITGVFVGTGTRIVRFTATTATNLTRATPYSGVSLWTFTPYGSKVLAGSLEEPLQAWSGTGLFTNAITSTTKPQPRYISTVGSMVFGGYVDVPTDPLGFSKVWWSAINDETNWEPGSGRAGFSYLPGKGGQITGVHGFEDYAIVLQRRAIHRFERVAGATTFDVHQIGGPDEGCVGELSSVARGTDIYYLSSGGYRVIRSGEAVASLDTGKVRRFFFDNEVAPSAAKVVPSLLSSAVVSDSHQCYLHADDDQTREMRVYNYGEDRWGRVLLPDILPANGPIAWDTGDFVHLFQNGSSARTGLPLGDCGAATAFYDGSTTSYILVADFDVSPGVAKHVWRRAPASRWKSRIFSVRSQDGVAPIRLHGVRPIMGWDTDNAVAPGLGGDPVVTIDVQYSHRHKDHDEDATNGLPATLKTLTLVSADEDDHGFFRTDLPVDGTYFRFILSISSFGIEGTPYRRYTLRELIGLDLDVEVAGGR